MKATSRWTSSFYGPPGLLARKRCCENGNPGGLPIRIMTTDYQDPSPALIKSIREKLGLSQAERAVELDVHEQTVSKWERGERPTSRMLELALCELARRRGRKRRQKSAS